ncbi:MAG: hypothetical protein Q7S77_01185 [Candidatus Staskawiczbacteria bacterium]|nr:hypothetical protein [Candidatus Staskawiczbacteria bacterium]
MSTKAKSIKKKRNDLRMVFFKTGEDGEKARDLIREKKVPQFIDYNVTTLKAISLLEKEGVKFKAIKKPINTSDLTPEQREDVRDRRAKLIKIKSLDLIFFFEAQS